MIWIAEKGNQLSAWLGIGFGCNMKNLRAN